MTDRDAIPFGHATIVVAGVYVVESWSDGEQCSFGRADAERSLYIDICVRTGVEAFYLRASAVRLASDILVLLSEIASLSSVDIALGDGEFSISGIADAGRFDLALTAHRKLGHCSYNRDQLAMFFCRLLSDICVKMSARGIHLDRLFGRFPVLG